MLIQYYLAAMITVKKAAVLGAGTMGAQISAHIANAGIPTLLLDIVPRDEAPAPEGVALARPSGSVAETRPSGRVPNADDQKPDRNRIARAGFEAAKKSKPAAFFTTDFSSLVTIGNFDD